MTEIWLPIPDFIGRYDVSNFGRIRSLLTNKILATAKNPNGYVHTHLSLQNGERKSIDIHRIVMLAFHGPSKLTVNHKNGDKSDNRLENLEYATRSENQQHALKVLGFQPRFGERHPHAKLTVKDVIAIRQLVANGKEIASVGAQFNKSSGAISDIVSGKAWRHAPGPIRPSKKYNYS